VCLPSEQPHPLEAMASIVGAAASRE
jgi:hypothetical protein